MSDRDREIIALSARLNEVSSDLNRHLAEWLGGGARRQLISRAGPRQTAQRLLWEIDRRSRYLDADLFSDPAWCILLDLYVQTASGKKVSVSSACIGARVPPTTALRWISIMVERGLVERHPDPHDARRVNLELASGTQSKMTAYLESISMSDESATSTSDFLSYG